MTRNTTARASIALFAIWMTLWPAVLLDAPDWVGAILLGVVSVLIGYLAGDATALVLAPRRARRARRRRVRLHYEGRAGENAIRVSEQEAARLQSFPDDYPWAAAGTRSAQFQCIGNAVPPLMGAAILKGLTGR